MLSKTIYVRNEDADRMDAELARLMSPTAVGNVGSLDVDDGWDTVDCSECGGALDDDADSEGSGVCLDCRRHGRGQG